MVVAEILADLLEDDATKSFENAAAGNGFREVTFIQNHPWLACASSTVGGGGGARSRTGWL